MYLGVVDPVNLLTNPPQIKGVLTGEITGVQENTRTEYSPHPREIFYLGGTARCGLPSLSWTGYIVAAYAITNARQRKPQKRVGSSFVVVL